MTTDGGTETPAASAPEPEEAGALLARRTVLGALGVSAIGGMTAAVLGLTGRGAPSVRVAAASATPSTTATRSVAPTASAASSHTDHDAQAEAVVKAFPAKTAGLGLQEPA